MRTWNASEGDKVKLNKTWEANSDEEEEGGDVPCCLNMIDVVDGVKHEVVAERDRGVTKKVKVFRPEMIIMMIWRMMLKMEWLMMLLFKVEVLVVEEEHIKYRGRKYNGSD